MLKINLIAIAITFVFSPVLLAETRYVTDQLEITLRSGQSTKHQILRMLPSGQAVETLEDDEETKYSRIRTAQGDEGWVLTRYLDKESSARDRLAKAEKVLAELDERYKRTREELRQANSKIKELSQNKSSAEQQSQQLESELNRIKRVSSDVISIDKENTALKAELLQLQLQHDQNLQQIERLQDRTARDWFMVGAGVVLLGILIGLVIPKIRWKRKSSWSSL